MSNSSVAQKIVVFNAPRERLEEKIEPVAPMEPTAIESDSSCESVVVSIPASKPHRLKNHFLGCAREVIGYLDILADNNSDRFIRPRVSNIVAHCNRFKNKGKGAGYSQTTVERCLRALRDSGLIKKQKRNGKIGYIVMNHGEACRLSPDGFCELVSGFKINWLRGKATYQTTPSRPSETLSTFGINNLADDSTTHDTKSDGLNDTKSDGLNDTKSDGSSDGGAMGRAMGERWGSDGSSDGTAMVQRWYSDGLSDGFTSKNLSVNYRKKTTCANGAPSNLETVEPLSLRAVEPVSRGAERAVGTCAPPPSPPSPSSNQTSQTPASRETNPASRGVRIGEQRGVAGKVTSDAKNDRDTASGRESIRKKLSAIALSKVGPLERWPEVWEGIGVLVEAFGEPAVIAAFGEWVSLQDGSVDRPMQSFLGVAAWLIKSANPANPANPATIRNSFDRLLARLAEVSNRELTWTDAQRVSLYAALKRHGEDNVVSAFRLFYSNLEDDFELKFAAKNFVEQLSHWIAKVAYLKAQKEEYAKLEARFEEEGRRKREERLRKKAEEEALVEYELGELTNGL